VAIRPDAAAALAQQRLQCELAAKRLERPTQVLTFGSGKDIRHPVVSQLLEVRVGHLLAQNRHSVPDPTETTAHR
jgi:hypothetical protein